LPTAISWADRPTHEQIRGYFKMLQIGAAQGIDGIGSLIAPVPTSFISRMALEAASDKRIRGMHYYSGFGAAAVKHAIEVNHKLTTGQFTASGNAISLQNGLGRCTSIEESRHTRIYSTAPFNDKAGWLTLITFSRFRLRRYTSGHRRGSHGSCARSPMLNHRRLHPGR